jgi:hypothetical protein
MTEATLPVHLPTSPLAFDGATYEPDRDGARLFAQLARVRSAMKGAGPLTLKQISALTGDPESSVGARVRDLRKQRFGGHTVARTYAGDGLWLYQLIT